MKFSLKPTKNLRYAIKDLVINMLQILKQNAQTFIFYQEMEKTNKYIKKLV